MDHEQYLNLWIEARTRFTDQLAGITGEDLGKKLPPSQNSIGFLIRHIGDVELLFAKNVFGAENVRIIAKTLIAQHDTGEWTDLTELIEHVSYSFETLKGIIENQVKDSWKVVIQTKEFGAKTKAKALARIIAHTAYHAGQMALINKYGKA